MIVKFRVHGTPAPQGSKVRTRYGMREASLLVGPWREAVVGQVMRDGNHDMNLDGPLYVEAVFWHKRPGKHYGTKNGQPYIKDNAPTWVATTPDHDKCLRSTFDGLTQSGLIVDDSRIVVIYSEQRYSNDHFTGADIIVKQIEETP